MSTDCWLDLRSFLNSDHIEGQALIAERNAHAYDDGVISKGEKKALDAAHKKQLHNRHRGVAQFKPYRTAIWMKEGLKSRVTLGKSSGKREREFCLRSLHHTQPNLLSLAAVRTEA